ncbi:MAG TPA: Ig-like domain-containing protein [Pseudonocardia sp.]|jgi:lipoprotein-anchoring transpeptidase ErfK/SrfK|nr:Ig-like domain-containing protein [Pseudonocardia sp.]
MSGGLTALAETDSGRRKITLALGAASAVIALFALITATRGPAATTSALEDKPAPPAKPVATVSIQADATTPINPTTPISVAVQQGTLRAVTVTDSHSGKSVPGQLASGGTSWQSSGQLTYNDTYQIAVTAVGSDQKTVQRAGTVTTIKPALQAYPSFIPAPGKNSVGVGQPLVVKFDHPVTDRAAAERALHVTASPEQSGNWYWISGSEAHYRPQNYWEPNTTVTLNAQLFGVDLGKGTFGQVNRSETIHVHDSWVAKADGKSETMQIYQNGNLVKTMPISLGSPGHPSHSGPHVISDKQSSIIMDSCTYGVCKGDKGYYREKVDLDERISNDGEFVHAAPWSVGQQGDSNVSHGCVNLSVPNAQWFFNHMGVGDVVEISNSGGPTLPVYDTYGDWAVSWSQWQAGSALNATN